VVLAAYALYFLDVSVLVCLLWVGVGAVVRVKAICVADVAFCALHVVCELSFVGVSFRAYAC
jgi:hypothetical protein